jgi:hypothetical protein
MLSKSLFLYAASTDKRPIIVIIMITIIIIPVINQMDLGGLDYNICLGYSAV